MQIYLHAATLLLAFAAHLAAAEAPPQSRALAGAALLAKAVMERNAVEVVRLTLPDLVWALGGDAKMIEIMQAKFDEAQRAGAVIESVTLGTPSALGKDGSTHFVFIPYTHVARAGNTRVIDDAFFLAISDDAGDTWHYVDGIGLDEAQIRRAFVRGYNGKPPVPKVNRRFEKV